MLMVFLIGIILFFLILFGIIILFLFGLSLSLSIDINTFEIDTDTHTFLSEGVDATKFVLERQKSHSLQHCNTSIYIKQKSWMSYTTHS